MNSLQDRENTPSRLNFTLLQCNVILFFTLKTHNPAVQARMQELNDDLQASQESARVARGQESSLKQEVNRLNQELQKSQRFQRRLQSEKEAQEKDIQELQKQIKRLRGALQVSRRRHR